MTLSEKKENYFHDLRIVYKKDIDKRELIDNIEETIDVMDKLFIKKLKEKPPRITYKKWINKLAGDDLI